MPDFIDKLIEVSRKYGTDKNYIIAGGGNTSYKDENKLWVKASGIRLADIDEGGFVCMARDKLGLMNSKDYPQDSVKLREEVRKDLERAVISPRGLRPSIETSLHNIIDYKYIVHTHPCIVNSVMCSKRARETVEELFGDEALYVEYTEPGYSLFKKLMGRINEYSDRYKIAPKIIFLQNHGVFVGADTTGEVDSLYDFINTRIVEGRDMYLPGSDMEEYNSPVAEAVSSYFRSKNLLTASFRSALSDHFCSGRDAFRKIERPFTPENISYCRSALLYLEQGLTERETIRRTESYYETHAYFPKLIFEEKQGIIVVERSEKSLATVKDVITDMMKISYLSEQFGGPHFLTPEQLKSVESW